MLVVTSKLIKFKKTKLVPLFFWVLRLAGLRFKNPVRSGKAEIEKAIRDCIEFEKKNRTEKKKQRKCCGKIERLLRERERERGRLAKNSERRVIMGRAAISRVMMLNIQAPARQCLEYLTGAQPINKNISEHAQFTLFNIFSQNI